MVEDNFLWLLSCNSQRRKKIENVTLHNVDENKNQESLSFVIVEFLRNIMPFKNHL